MDLVAPHVGRALQLQQRITHVETAGRTLEAALDANGDALLVLNAAGRILSANRAADAELASGRCVATRSGRLIARCANDDAALQSAIRVTAAVTESVALSCPPSVAMRLRHGTIAITCFPLSMRHVEDTRTQSAARVLISISDASKRTQGLAHLLRFLYGLTPTEALLAEGLADGDDLEEIAQRLRMTKGTARIHLRHVFLKTSTRRQAQLVALILRAVPVALMKR
jgi:DNA-binding CsgD family transcriptional regulator